MNKEIKSKLEELTNLINAYKPKNHEGGSYFVLKQGINRLNDRINPAESDIKKGGPSLAAKLNPRFKVEDNNPQPKKKRGRPAKNKQPKNVLASSDKADIKEDLKDVKDTAKQIKGE